MMQTIKTTTLKRKLALFVAIIMALASWMSMPLQASADTGTPATVGDFAIAATGDGETPEEGTDYTYVSNILTITSAKAMTISMKAGLASGTTKTDTIAMDSESPANITIDNVKIDVSAIADACAFDVGTSALNLTLSGSNLLKSNGISAGLQVKEGAVVTIASVGGDGTETGKLQAFGGQGNPDPDENKDHSAARGAGIGAPMATDAGTITINGGTIEAYGGYDSDGSGAGIGGGGARQGTQETGGSGGTITINGGKVYALNSPNTNILQSNGGAAIGGGGGHDESDKTGGQGGIIAINGGEVTAYANECGAAIGNANRFAGKDDQQITITGGEVEATSADFGAGIGGGGYTSGGIIAITGGDVTASGGPGAAGIGGGGYGNGGDITIIGGNITANGGYVAAGIGGGLYGNGGDITITGGNIIANGASSAAGIGGGGGGNGGTINITGGLIYATVTGTSAVAGAGIGGAYKGSAGAITISGGIIIASGGDVANRGADIGSGYYDDPNMSTAGGSVDITGGTILAVGDGENGLGSTTPFQTTVNVSEDAVIFSPKISGYTQQGNDTTSSIVIGSDFTIDKNQQIIRLNRDVTIPAGAEFVIPPGWTLYVNGKTFINNGTLVDLGEIKDGSSAYTPGGSGAIKKTYITISAQPRDKLIEKKYVAEKLSATAFVISALGEPETVTPAYQWYSAETKSTENGTLIPGATSAEFALPEGLDAGDHYYYVAAEADDTPTKNSRVATVTVVPDRYSLAIDPQTKDFDPQTVDYETAPDAQEFTVTNCGTEQVTNLTAALGEGDGSAFTISSGLSEDPLDADATATISIQPKTGLEANTYTDTLTVSGTGAGGDNPSIEVTLSFTVAAAPTYTLTVIGGTDMTDDGPYEEGTEVRIAADDPEDGMAFDKWIVSDGNGGSFDNETSPETVFTMPTGEATVTATYKDIPPMTYPLHVVNGTDMTNAGPYTAGAEVSITADSPADGQAFDKWIVSGGNDGSFYNETSPETVFTMPAGEATVTATYKDIPPVTYIVVKDFGKYTGNGTVFAEVDANHLLFVQLLYDGTEIDSAYYTVTKGSTVITLHENYLRTFKNGTYLFIAEFTNGTSEYIELVVDVPEEDETPGTGGDDDQESGDSDDPENGDDDNDDPETGGDDDDQEKGDDDNTPETGDSDTPETDGNDDDTENGGDDDDQENGDGDKETGDNDDDPENGGDDNDTENDGDDDDTENDSNDDDLKPSDSSNAKKGDSDALKPSDSSATKTSDSIIPKTGDSGTLKPSDSDAAKSSNRGAPKTGDTSASKTGNSGVLKAGNSDTPLFWLIILLISALGALIVAVLWKRQEQGKTSD
jgi:hypothetical protein